jgi:hypothetical protein
MSPMPAVDATVNLVRISTLSTPATSEHTKRS